LEKNKEIVPRETTFMEKPMASPDKVIEYNQRVRELIAQSMKHGIDYGKVPKTEKDTLFKAGAELICKSFNARAEYHLVESEKDHNFECVYYDKYKNKKNSLGLYRYLYRCSIRMPDGSILGEGDGSCSSLEQKYIWAPRNNENVVCKMAQKRALVGAVLNSFALSDRFTQDLDDSAAVPTTAEIYTETPKQKETFAILAKKFNMTDPEKLRTLSANLKGTEMVALEPSIKGFLSAKITQELKKDE